MLNKAIWAVPRGRHVVPRGVQDKIWLTKKGNKRQGFCRIMTEMKTQSPELWDLLGILLSARGKKRGESGKDRDGDQVMAQCFDVLLPQDIERCNNNLHAL